VSPTLTLTEFLMARIAEDEAVAKAATPGPWKVDNETYAETIYAADGFTAVVAGGRWGGEAPVFDSTADAVHIVRHNPARVLAECEAKRRILTYAEHNDDVYLLGSYLALPYADHESFQAEWRA